MKWLDFFNYITVSPISADSSLQIIKITKLESALILFLYYIAT
uniref:Uncharacterized protein n=1 Tax=uncultured Desulfobacterium sp. TaxID=201089 RepID=E1YHA3_9BACT|nr:unknown protein [uncultured Desulfobacterium sp.]